jgi:hypothetical protein
MKQIINKVQDKKLPDYQNLMAECFKEYYRVLKPQMVTVEFSNTQFQRLECYTGSTSEMQVLEWQMYLP